MLFEVAPHIIQPQSYLDRTVAKHQSSSPSSRHSKSFWDSSLFLLKLFWDSWLIWDSILFLKLFWDSCLFLLKSFWDSWLTWDSCLFLLKSFWDSCLFLLKSCWNSWQICVPLAPTCGRAGPATLLKRSWRSEC